MAYESRQLFSSIPAAVRRRVLREGGGQLVLPRVASRATVTVDELDMRAFR